MIDEEQPTTTIPSTTPVEEGGNETTTTMTAQKKEEMPGAAAGGSSKLVTEIKTARGVVKLPSLFDACKTGHLPIVRYYLENDPSIDINAVDEEGGTLLHWAAYNGYSDIVIYLIKRGAEVNPLSVPTKQ